MMCKSGKFTHVFIISFHCTFEASTKYYIMTNAQAEFVIDNLLYIITNAFNVIKNILIHHHYNCGMYFNKGEVLEYSPYELSPVIGIVWIIMQIIMYWSKL